MNKIPFISVVVPTYKRPKDLNQCISRLLLLNYPGEKYEIIIVDDGSKDETGKMVQEIIKNNKRNKIFYLTQENSGPASARNKGLKKSKGEIIFFVDDDVLVPRDWIKKHLQWYEDSGVGGVGGNVLPKILSWPDKYYVARYIDEYLEIQRWEKFTGKGFATANCSYRTKILKEIKGFDESFPLAAGEDIDLSRRVMEKGWVLIKDPRIVSEHLRSETFKSVIKLKFKRMSGAVIDNKKEMKRERIYHLSRIFKQWRDFKIANRKIFHKKVTILDFVKFIYLTFMLFVASVRGMKHFNKKLNSASI